MSDDTKTEPRAPAPRPGFTIRVSPRLVIIVAAAVVVVSAGIATSIAVTHRAAASQTFTVYGALALTDSNDPEAIAYLGSGMCEGSSGFDDISAGANVTVYNASGTVVGTGELSAGASNNTGCTFAFTVHDVPAGSKFYQVEISHRGRVTESASELRNGPVFTLGN